MWRISTNAASGNGCITFLLLRPLQKGRITKLLIQSFQMFDLGSASSALDEGALVVELNPVLNHPTRML